MDNANYAPRMVLEVAGQDVLGADPFVLVDVGCGLGIDSVWRSFGRHLHAFGLDPQLDEIERLAAEEENPNVRYHAALVGLAGHEPVVEDSFYNPLGRTSAMAAIARAREAGDVSLHETNAWSAQVLATEKIGLADFLRSQAVEQVDFVKTDTAGGDLEVLRSFEDLIEPSRTLG